MRKKWYLSVYDTKKKSDWWAQDQQVQIFCECINECLPLHRELLLRELLFFISSTYWS